MYTLLPIHNLQKYMNNISAYFTSKVFNPVKHLFLINFLLIQQDSQAKLVLREWQEPPV